MSTQERSGIVCVFYTLNFIEPTLCALGDIARQNGAFHTVLVANCLSAFEALKSRTEAMSHISVILHDNSGMEFGAYQVGLRHLQVMSNPEWVIFANDTFVTHNSFGFIYRGRLQQQSARNLEWPAAIGQIVGISRAFKFGQFLTHRWLTTHIFALNRAAIDALGGRIYCEEIDCLIHAHDNMDRFFSPELHVILREHLEAWLFRARPGWHWYGSEPLTAANASRMAAKGRSVLQEKYLSARLEWLSADIVDLNELTLLQKFIRSLERKLFDLTRPRG